MDSVEVPQYFICPISLQIMKDPVTATTGITYDRSSIERWLFSDNNVTCPVTNQPLPKDSDDQYLTPNHTLRRLIQAWCTANAVDRIPTPRAPVGPTAVTSLLRDLSNPSLQLNSLRLLEKFTSDNLTNRRTIIQAGGPRFILRVVVSCAKTHQFDRAKLALNLLQSLRIPNDELKTVVADLIDTLTPLLRHESKSIRSFSIILLKSVTELASSSLLERLQVKFFEGVISIIHDNISQQATKAALHVLLSASPLRNNRTKIVEAGAVTELIELELTGPDKRRTELGLGVLAHLCGCADGRAQLVGHAAGIPVVAKRILRVSAAADEWAVGILSLVCKYSATSQVVQEMVRVGGVSKMCYVLQSDCERSVREKVRLVLRLHSGVWKNSACVDIYLLTISV